MKIYKIDLWYMKRDHHVTLYGKHYNANYYYIFASPNSKPIRSSRTKHFYSLLLKLCKFGTCQISTRAYHLQVLLQKPTDLSEIIEMC